MAGTVGRAGVFLGTGYGLALAVGLAQGAGLGLTGASFASSFELHDGEVVEGELLQANRNTLTIRSGVSMRPVSISDVRRVVLDLADGGAVEGELLGWADGAFELRTEERTVRVQDGVIVEDLGDAPLPVARSAPPAPDADGQAADQQAADRWAADGRAAPEAPLPVARDGGPGERIAIEGGASIVMADGEVVDGEIVHATGSVVTLISEAGGPAPVSRLKIKEIRFTTTDGEVLGGALIDWRDGIYRLSQDAGSELMIDLAAETGLVQARGAGGLPAAAQGSGSETEEAQDQQAQDQQAGNEEAGGSSGDEDLGQDAAALPDRQTEAEIARIRPAATKAPHLVNTHVAPARESDEAVVFEFRLDQPTERPLVILYAVTDGSAKSGQDFEPQSGVVTFDAGSSQAEVRVPLIDNDRPDGSKTFRLFLSGDPEAVQFGERQVIATIEDDD